MNSMMPFERALAIWVIGFGSFVAAYFIFAYFGEVLEHLRALRQKMDKERKTKPFLNPKDAFLVALIGLAFGIGGFIWFFFKGTINNGTKGLVIEAVGLSGA